VPVGHRANTISFREIATAKLKISLVPKAGKAMGLTEIEAWGGATLPITAAPPPTTTAPVHLSADSPRRRISLNGEWLFRRDTPVATPWKAVQVPSAFQEHEGTDFHGVGYYKKVIEPMTLPPGKRILL